MWRSGAVLALVALAMTGVASGQSLQLKISTNGPVLEGEALTFHVERGTVPASAAYTWELTGATSQVTGPLTGSGTLGEGFDVTATTVNDGTPGGRHELMLRVSVGNGAGTQQVTTRFGDPTRVALQDSRTVKEGAIAGFLFKFLDPPLLGGVPKFHLVDGTAHAPVDYDPTAKVYGQGTGTIIAVPTKADADPKEGDETFRVVLDPTRGYEIVKPDASATIVDGPQVIPPDRCVVPDVIGQPLAAARQMLRNRHCKTGKVIKRRVRRAKVGRVTKTSPRAGMVLAFHAPVTLVVARR